jgi:hypothetical protein
MRTRPGPTTAMAESRNPEHARRCPVSMQLQSVGAQRRPSSIAMELLFESRCQKCLACFAVQTAGSVAIHYQLLTTA